MQNYKWLLIPLYPPNIYMLELSTASTQCTHDAACFAGKGIDNHFTPSLVAKWVNGRSRPSYDSDTRGQGDYPLLVRVYIES
jgi:hypothetical protein